MTATWFMLGYNFWINAASAAGTELEQDVGSLDDKLTARPPCGTAFDTTAD